MKLGRNDSCHCGSGKKYKRCCLDADKAAPVGGDDRKRLIDGTSVRMLQLYIENEADFKQRYTAPADELEIALIKRIGDGVEGEASLDALSDFMAAAEERMKALLASHSRLFWLHVSHRVPPKPLYGATAWTTMLYRTVFSLAVLKHGRPYDERDDMDMSSGTLLPRELTHEDHLAIYQVEQLAVSYNHAAASYRRVAKGATLRRDPGGTFRADADDEIEGLIASIDGRVSKYNEILSPFGSTADANALDLFGGDAYDILLCATLNVTQTPWPEELLNAFGMSAKDDPLAGLPNYLIRWIDLLEVGPVLRAFEDPIREITGMAVDEMLAFLWALGWRHYLAMRDQPFAAYQFMQRGYWLTTEGERYERTVEETAGLAAVWWKNKVAEDLDEECGKDIVRRGFVALTYTEDDFNGIDLWSRVPSKPILSDGGYIVWDYSAFVQYFRTLFETIGALTGAVGNVKGENFENEVAEAVGKHPELALWHFQQELKAHDGAVREVDVSFVAEDTLFLAECKAVSAHPRLDRGEPEILARRWQKMLDHLAQVDSLRAFLLENPSGANYAVPEHITEIKACVCTPMAEYIPTREPDLWLTSEVPRVCVPAELISVALQKD